MKSRCFLALSVAGVLFLAGNSLGGELQWKKPGSSEAAAKSVAYIPTVISTDDAVGPSEFLLVQHTTPVQQLPRLTQPAQTTGTPLEPCTDQIGLLKSIKDISHDIRPTTISGELPPECAIEGEVFNGRHFEQTCFMWKASAVSTQAAYFEDVQLERYGHTIVCPALQPIVSGARFFATVPILPYKMGVTPPKECVYTLGHYKAGNCAPYMVEPFPISPRGALFQAGAVAGGILAIP